MRLKANEFVLWQRASDTARTAIQATFIAHTQYVYLGPWYCNPSFHPKTNQMVLRNAATARSMYDFLGTRVSPCERRGFHKKKISTGTAAPAIQRWTDTRKKAGSTVIAGNGCRIVGYPVMRNPIEAGINRPKPPMVVASLWFMLRPATIGNYFLAKRSKSAIWRSISSRAESDAERMPWMRSLNSSALEARARASSRVMSCFE